MDNFQWRSRARIVAYVDIIFSILGLILMGLLVFFLTFATVAGGDDKQNVTNQNQTEPDHEHPQLELSSYLVIVCVLVAIATVTTFINLWASIMLLKATKLGADAADALRRACIWRNVCVVFLILGIIGNIASGRYYALVVSTVFRLFVIYVVWKFIEELETAVKRSLPNPVAVTVKA